MKQHADIISCSWGFVNGSPELCEAVEGALKRGILVFASASNTGLNEKTPPYPAAITGVYTIGACDNFGYAAKFTSPNATYLLPGKNIISTYPKYLNDAGTRCLSGCSMATAISAGLAARILEFGHICGMDTMELRKDEKMHGIFKKFARGSSGRYVFPWDKIPPAPGEQNFTEWMRVRFFGDI